MDGRGSEFGVENVVEPSPFEVGRANGLGFVAGDEQGNRTTAELAKAKGEASDEEGFDGGEVLAFINGDAIPRKVGGGKLGKLCRAATI